MVECRERSVAIDCRQLCGQERHLVREVLIAVWRQQDWPLQAMGYAEWEALAELALVSETATASGQHLFPGGITARRRAERLVLAAPDDAGPSGDLAVR